MRYRTSDHHQNRGQGPMSRVGGGALGSGSEIALLYNSVSIVSHGRASMGDLESDTLRIWPRAL